MPRPLSADAMKRPCSRCGASPRTRYGVYCKPCANEIQRLYKGGNGESLLRFRWKRSDKKGVA